MEKYTLAHMNPNLAMVAQVFPEGTVHDSGSGKSYLDVRIFRSSLPMSENILYLVREEDAADFPGDTYASICQAPIPGAADHITVPGLTDAQVLDRAMALFSRCREQEQLLDELVFQGVTLQQLCESGAELLDNPVYIHDDWFMMLAQSSQVDDILTPEYTMTSQRGFLPRVIVDDLQFDSDYLETYTTHDVQLWHSSSKTADCIYVNLWDGAVYRGRLLVMETNHPFRPSDYRLAEVLAQRAMSCLHYRAEYEMKGVPLRVECGPRDLENDQCVLVRRTDREKVTVNLEDLEAAVEEQLNLVHQGMYERAKKNLEDHIYEAHSLEEAKELQEKNGGFIKTMWCGSQECELKMKEVAGMSSRCIPFKQEHLGDTCACCGKPASKMIYWGIAY